MKHNLSSYYLSTTIIVCALLIGFCQADNNGIRWLKQDSASSTSSTSTVTDATHLATDSGEANNSDDKCAICLCEFDNNKKGIKLKCGHIFHQVCLDRWFKTENQCRSLCPMCRGPLLLEDGTFFGDLNDIEQRARIHNINTLIGLSLSLGYYH